METGVVKWFRADKGYGFIAGDSGEDAFVHYTEINSDGYKTLSEGYRVTYDVVKSPKGLSAANVSVT